MFVQLEKRGRGRLGWIDEELRVMGVLVYWLYRGERAVV
jgi:hypothetical protein